jgi:hypothetical protein
MQYRFGMRFAAAAIVVILLGGSPAGASPQQSQPPTSTTPDDAPSIAVGAVLFQDFSYALEPTTTDSDGNAIHFNQFNVSRTFIDVKGRISRLVGFRITPDIARETSAFSNIAGSLELRLMYAYAQFNFDAWMPPGSNARFGIQPTPWLELADAVYRYRFQGTTFAEREGYLGPSDAGASFLYALPSGYGDLQVGVFNGENFNKAEVNNQKSVQMLATVRPFANPSAAAVVRGLRGSIFYDDDRYVRNGPRRRLIGAVTFEHPRVNASVEVLRAADRTSITKPQIDGSGYSIWATPVGPHGLEGLVRYDRLQPNTLLSAQRRSRTIVGIAYWLPRRSGVTSALLLDYEAQTFENVTPAQPRQAKLAIHGLFQF